MASPNTIVLRNKMQEVKNLTHITTLPSYLTGTVTRKYSKPYEGKSERRQVIKTRRLVKRMALVKQLSANKV